MESIDGEPPRKRRKEQHEREDDVSKRLTESLEQAARLDERSVKSAQISHVF
jgi:hypothetical protein